MEVHDNSEANFSVGHLKAAVYCCVSVMSLCEYSSSFKQLKLDTTMPGLEVAASTIFPSYVNTCISVGGIEI